MLKVDDKDIIKRMITLCWICLFICVLLKVTGCYTFNISVNNTIQTICSIIDNNIILSRSVQFVIFYITTFLYFNIILYGKLPAHFNYLYIVLFIIRCINLPLATLLDIWCMLMIPLLYKVRITTTFKHFIHIAILQLVSVYLREVSGLYWPANSVMGIFMSFDYCIMLMLLYLYKRKEVL